MNESEKHADKVENVRQAEVKSGVVVVGQMMPQRGHTIFEYDMITGELRKPEIETPEEIAKFEVPKKRNLQQPKTVGRILERPDCIYIWALNRKNAIKVLAREHGITYIDG